jgi:hypothetical protein
MHLLNEKNESIDLNLIPNECDIHFWVYDVNKDVRDYHVAPLIMLDNFYSPVVKLTFTDDSYREPIKYSLTIPADYSILIGTSSYNDLELIPVTNISNRGFTAFENNPLSSFRVQFFQVDIQDILPNVKWFVPRLAVGQILCVPLSTKPKSPCVYIARDMPKSMECFPLKDAL